ncbi:MAG: hypothetical protein KDA64_07080 [Rhodospirillaceae bacterium]|nr:hypothetical protein [Rhodospirillaceae bacterium]
MQIVYLAAFPPLVLWLVFRGYDIGDRAVAMLMKGDWRGWLVGLLAIFVACGSTGILLPVGFWAVFEGGLSYLLGL